MATTAKKTPSTAVAKKAATNIVSIQEALKKQAADLNSRVAPPSGIKIGVTQAKEFKLPDGRKSNGPLELVILDFLSVNSFYEGAYDKDNIAPPACFAIGDSPLQLVPSDNSPLKQADACKGCPMNEFGSAGKGKACKNTRLLAVLPPDADADTPIWTLSVSPTALKGFDAYVRQVASSFQMPPVSVVTTVSFDEGVDYACLVFGDPKPNDNLAVHYARQEEARKILEAEPDVSQFAPAAKQPAKKVANARSVRR